MKTLTSILIAIVMLFASVSTFTGCSSASPGKWCVSSCDLPVVYQGIVTKVTGNEVHTMCLSLNLDYVSASVGDIIQLTYDTKVGGFCRDDDESTYIVDIVDSINDRGLANGEAQIISANQITKY